MTHLVHSGDDIGMAICSALGLDPNIVGYMDLRLEPGHVPELFLSIHATGDGIRALDWGALFKANGFEVNIHIIDE